MKFNFVFTAALMGLALGLAAQTLEEFEIKSNGYAEKKMKKAPRKVYIAEFEINYQLMVNWSETAQGGYQMGGGYRGDATANLVLGIPNIDVNALQANTDAMYKSYVDQLTGAGFEIISPDEAAKSKMYSDWTRIQGGSPSEAQNPGFIQTTPTGFEYFKQKITNKGRAKTGNFYSIQLTKLSREMGDAIIAMVKINIPVFEDAESGMSKALADAGGGVAKIVARANYRLTPGIYVMVSKVAGEFIPTQCSFYYSNQAQGLYTIKKDVPITGVFDAKKKYKAAESASTDWGTSMGAMTVFSPDDKTMTQMQKVECDPEKYVTGARIASETFINESMKSFLENAVK